MSNPHQLGPPSLHEDLEWFLRNLDLQLDDIVLGNQGNTLVYYWDNAAVGQAILGMAGLYNVKTGRFEREKFKDRGMLVSCLAAAGYLGPMKLLLPHQVEFSNGLASDFNLPDGLFPPGGVDQFVRDAELSHTLTLKEFHAKSPEDKASVVESYADDVERFFKIVQSIRGDWESRAASMYKNGHINLSTEMPVDYGELLEGSMFRELARFFDRKRSSPEKRIANRTDAVALCLLQQQVSDFSSGRVKALPRFFESSPLFREAMAEIGQLELLSYASPHEGRMSVLRDADYYVFRATFNPQNDLTGGETHQRFIDALRSARAEVARIREGPLTTDDLEQIVVLDKPLTTVIQELRRCWFLEHVWLPYAGTRDLVEASNYHVQNLLRISGDESFRAVIGEIRETLSKNVRDYEWLSELSRALEERIAYLQSRFGQSVGEPLDVIRLFALLRFGVPPKYHDRINRVVRNLLGREEHGIAAAKMELLRHCHNAKRKIDRETALAIAIPALWVLEMDREIHEVSKGEERGESWAIAIRAAAAIRSGRHEAAKRTTEALTSRYDKLRSGSAKGELALAIAYLYYHMWREGGGEISWRNDRRLITSCVPGDLELWKENALRFSREAYAIDYLSPSIKAYAVNLYLYYATEAGSDDLFTSLTSLAQQLVEYQPQTSIWQYRFDDTLARFFHRSSTLASSSEKRAELMRLAKHRIHRASAACHGDPAVESYEAILATIE